MRILSAAIPSGAAKYLLPVLLLILLGLGLNAAVRPVSVAARDPRAKTENGAPDPAAVKRVRVGGIVITALSLIASALFLFLLAKG